MKPIHLLIAASMIQLTSAQPAAKTAVPTPQQQAEAYYQNGQAAEKSGDADAAKQAYAAALKANPNHANAQYSLAQLKITGPKIAAKGREAKFGSVIVPEFNVTDMTLVECLEFLRTTMIKQSEGKVTPNFIVQDPKNAISPAKIELKLKNMPASAIMKYLLDQTQTKARYDEFAIIVTPR